MEITVDFVLHTIYDTSYLTSLARVIGRECKKSGKLHAWLNCLIDFQKVQYGRSANFIFEEIM